MDSLLFRRYSFALSRSLRLEGVLGAGGGAGGRGCALHALAGSELTLERYAGDVERAAKRRAGNDQWKQNFKRLYLSQIEVDVALFWTSRCLSSS